MINNMESTKQWLKAKKYLDDVIQSYKDLLGISGVNSIFGLAYLNMLLTRYNQGERTEELLDDILKCE